MRKIKFILFILGFNTWPSWTGVGITLPWPGNKKKMNLQIKIIYFLKDLMLDDHKFLVQGPVFAAGDVKVIYIWPKDDPNVKKMLEKSKATQ